MSEPIEPCPNPECECEKPMRAFEYCSAPFHCVQCPECGMQGPLFDTHDGAIGAWNATVRAVREATEWRQRAEAAESAIAEHNSAMRAECRGCKATGGACEYCSMEYRIVLPARPADGEGQ